MTQKIRWQTCQSWCVVNRKHQPKTSIPTIPRSSISAMLTSCNEGTELIGNEYFTYNGENKDSKND